MNKIFEENISFYWSKWASFWDIMLGLTGLAKRYRKESIGRLNLEKGMTVLDVACGTGFNFPYLIEAVGTGGKIIAVDISPGMLEKAKQRVKENGWSNFEFILGDVSQIKFPKINAATAFWCMISIPDYQKTLENIIFSLSSKGRLAVLDFKSIDDFYGCLFNPIFEQICRFTHQDINREPWVYMNQLLDNVQMCEFKLMGLLLSNVYLAWGEKK